MAHRGHELRLQAIHLPPLRDVLEVAGESAAFGSRKLEERRLGVENFTVLASPPELRHPADRLLVYLPEEPLRIAGRSFGQEERDALTDQFLLPVADDPFRRRIYRLAAAVLVERDPSAE